MLPVDHGMFSTHSYVEGYLDLSRARSDAPALSTVASSSPLFLQYSHRLSLFASILLALLDKEIPGVIRIKPNRKVKLKDRHRSKKL